MIQANNPGDCSVIIPCLNEHDKLPALLEKLIPRGFEIVVVDDGSTPPLDNVPGVTIVRHPGNPGNGAAIKTGVRHSTRPVLVFMDADGQHEPDDIIHLLSRLNEGFDMVVGARTKASHSSRPRRIANHIYNTLASWITQVRIEDLTSGFRIAKRQMFEEFLHLLPNGFSYPATITMASLRSGYSVGFYSISAAHRLKGSHIKPLKNGAGFLAIIFKIGTLHSPLRIFGPAALILFASSVGYYSYTFFSSGQFTNMSLLLFLSSVFIFLIGLVSEQITMLMYSNKPGQH
ncbi:MAG: glycosyltransferase family 2 protein [Arenicellales bacterium WSBS_2016_MAG_OTU3]